MDGIVNLSQAHIGNTLSIVNIGHANNISRLDLRFAIVTTLDHASNSWPEQDFLLLNGLVYDALGDNFPQDSKRRLEWLRLQPRKQRPLQPYEQLAKVLKSGGYESAATEVLIAKQDDLRRHGDLKFSTKLLRGFLKYTIAYGYKPHLALRWVLLVVVIGTIFFQVGYDHGLMTRTKQSSNGHTSNEDYPQFHAFIYSAEFFVPIVDLRQKGYWSPNENKGHVIVKYPEKLRWGYLLTMYFWLQTCLGWALTTLWVAGFSGLVRRLN